MVFTLAVTVLGIIGRTTSLCCFKMISSKWLYWSFACGIPACCSGEKLIPFRIGCRNKRYSKGRATRRNGRQFVRRNWYATGTSEQLHDTRILHFNLKYVKRENYMFSGNNGAEQHVRGSPLNGIYLRNYPTSRTSTRRKLLGTNSKLSQRRLATL